MIESDGFLRYVPPMGIYRTLYAFRDAFGTYMGEPGTHPWSQGFPRTVPLPGGPDLPSSVTVSADDRKYPKAWGLPALREAIADYYRRHYGARITADNVMVFAGGRPAIVATLLFLAPDIRVRIAETEYTPYYDMLEAFGRGYDLVPSGVSNGFRPANADYLAATSGRVLALLSNPCNPTGVTRAGDDLAALVRGATSDRLGLLVDEAYELFHHPPVSALAHVDDLEASNLFVIGAATKGLQAPGIRIGWAVSSRRHIEVLSNFSSFGMGGVSHPSQSYAVELFGEQRVALARSAVPQFYGEQRARYGDAFDRLGLELHSGAGGFYHWCRLPGDFTASELNRRLFTHGAAILEGTDCDMARGGDGSPLRSFFRFSFGPLAPESFAGDIEILRRALDSAGLKTAAMSQTKNKLSAYRTLNPTTEQVVESFQAATAADVERAAAAAANAFAEWRWTTFAERAACLRAAAAALEARADELAGIMAEEMGKPLAQGVAEARKCATVCRYYADHGEEFAAPSPRESDASEAMVRYEPLGPVLAIMPWNFPFWQFFRFVAPALMAGNVALLKHAPNTPRSAWAMIDLLHRAGVPAGAAQNLYLTNEQAAKLIADHRIAAVTLTGSTGAGREVAAHAGRALKPMVLELGGSDPFIVLDGADIEQAAKVGVESRCLNSGQSCIAAKRFLVHTAVYDRFTEAFIAAMRARTMGDPSSGSADVGPLARQDLRDGLADQVERSLERGARALLGGARPARTGWFYPPTVLADIPDDSPAACEEMFGPVAGLFRVASDDAAVALANRTQYGLGASLWTSDRDRALRLIPRLDSGSVFVNGMVRSDPRLPFGGIKDSGFGRELGSEGMHEFMNAKTVWMKWS